VSVASVSQQGLRIAVRLITARRSKIVLVLGAVNGRSVKRASPPVVVLPGDSVGFGTSK
jgi:hypothetical protein